VFKDFDLIINILNNQTQLFVSKKQLSSNNKTSLVMSKKENCRSGNRSTDGKHTMTYICLGDTQLCLIIEYINDQVSL